MALHLQKYSKRGKLGVIYFYQLMVEAVGFGREETFSLWS